VGIDSTEYKENQSPKWATEVDVGSTMRRKGQRGRFVVADSLIKTGLKAAEKVERAEGAAVEIWRRGGENAKGE